MYIIFCLFHLDSTNLSQAGTTNPTQSSTTEANDKYKDKIKEMQIHLEELKKELEHMLKDVGRKVDNFSFKYFES